jgi:hypothetical protein
VTEADKPPKRPLSAFLRFMVKYRAGAAPVTTAADVQEQAKAGGAVWRAMSAHEQQAFKDEYTDALPAYAAAFAAWSAGVDPAKLRVLNAKRRARGKSAVRRARGAGHPATPYMRFLAQRPKLAYPPGADLAQRRAVFAEYSRANGAAWTAASDAEKKVRARVGMRAFLRIDAPAAVPGCVREGRGRVPRGAGLARDRVRERLSDVRPRAPTMRIYGGDVCLPEVKETSRPVSSYPVPAPYAIARNAIRSLVRMFSFPRRDWSCASVSDVTRRRLRVAMSEDNRPPQPRVISPVPNRKRAL